MPSLTHLNIRRSRKKREKKIFVLEVGGGRGKETRPKRFVFLGGQPPRGVRKP